MKIENRSEFLFAYRMRMLEHSAKEILQLMETQKLEDIPSLATIEGWIPRFDGIPESEKLRDRAFDWYKMEMYGIPWSASHSLLSAIPLLRRVEDPLSVRCIIWYWWMAYCSS